MKIGTLIFAGGKSSRMDTDKAALFFGGKNFTEHLINTLSDYNKLLFSRFNETQENFRLQTVYDIYPGCGPIEGLHAALTYCNSRALLTLPCDTPLFSAGLGRYLCSQPSSEYDAVILTKGNHIYPLCAVYKKEAAAILERNIKQNNFKMMSVLMELNVHFINIEETEYPANFLKKNQCLV